MPQRVNTFDRAWNDPSPSLTRLLAFDPGARAARRLPTAEEDEQLRAMYAESRAYLRSLGADLEPGDFYRPPFMAVA